MKTKTIKNYQYEGLGFPIQLAQVEMVHIDGEWQPKIAVRKVADKAIKTLASHNGRLTGNQIKFIRTYFSMSLRNFAQKVVRESHTAVNKWEAFGDKATNMDINIEILLRLYIIEQVEAKTVKQKNNFFNKYISLKKLCFFTDEGTPVLKNL